MPDITPNLGIKKPLGNENVSRASFNDNWDIIDANAAPVNKAQMAKLTKDDGYVFVPVATDLNNLTTSGFYYGNNLANAPEGSVYHRITVMMSSSTSGMQEATTNGGNRYIRNMTSGVWAGWKLQLSLSTNGQANIPSQSNISAIKNATLSLTSGVDTKLTSFTTEYRDTQNEFDTTAGEVTVKESGVYVVDCQIALSAAYSGNTYVKIYRNGVVWINLTAVTAQQLVYGMVIVQPTAGDKLTFYVTQNSGSTGSLTSAKIEMTKVS